MANKRVDETTAITMRRLGFSYKQIAEHLKCSEAWCAVNLKKIKPSQEQMLLSLDMFMDKASCRCDNCGMVYSPQKTVDGDEQRYTDDRDNYFCSSSCLSRWLLGDEFFENEVNNNKNYD